MATLQNFDAEIDRTRSVVNEMRGKLEQSGIVLGTDNAAVTFTDEADIADYALPAVEAQKRFAARFEALDRERGAVAAAV